ncbi:MAG: hypothetical protein LBP37_02445 [Spirochaetaceae bacterium]|jgi:hypothetical protein|nr:hypothetical protein [Spirochaetaceae bacterium]
MTHLDRVYLDALPVYAFLLFLLGASAVFTLRSPVVVVTDDVFSAVYGPRREHHKRIEMSVRLFRRIKLVRISESAEIDAVVFAADDAARMPLAAVFPYRYYDAALRYAALNPKTVPVVLAGLNTISFDLKPEQKGNPVLFIKQDENTDFYRAGLCAAFLSGREARPFLFPKKNDGGKTVLVIKNEKSSGQADSFFEQGMRKGESGASSVFKGINDNYPLSELSCFVLCGPSNGFLYSSTENEIPNIVFSWIDPDFSSPTTKIIIDDSPLQLLPVIVKSLRRGEVKKRLRAGENTEAFVPSTFKIMCLRTGSLPLILSLGIAANLPTPNEL